MRCPEFREKLPLYMHGRLSVQENRRAVLHLAGCNQCREEYIELESLKEALEEGFKSLGEAPEVLDPETLEGKSLGEVLARFMARSIVERTLSFAVPVPGIVGGLSWR